MTDFHIEITEQMPPASAVLYAKSMGLRAFALIFNAELIPEILQNGNESCFAQKKSTSPHTVSLLAKQKLVHDLAVYYDVQAIFGIKLKHVPPALMESAVSFYRSLGISFIGVHGESISDIVEQGTNFSAICAKADILFNPGLIDEKCVELAAENNVFLEISTHQKHAYANAHVAKLAQKYGAKLALGSHAGSLEEIHSPDMQKAVLKGACIEREHGCELLRKIQQF